MRRGRLVLTSLCCLLLTGTARAEPPSMSWFPADGLGQFLAEHFDLASIRSSFGPRRTAALHTFADFQMRPSKATDDLLEFESKDWFYQMRIVSRRDINKDGIEDLEVCFIDQGLDGATYLSAQDLLITRYGPDELAVALNYSVDACAKAAEQAKKDWLHSGGNSPRR